MIQEFVAKTTNAGAGGLMMILIEIIVWFVVILLSVLLVTAVRKIAVQYARRTVAGNVQNVAGSRDYIPLKLNAAGVMPIILTTAVLVLPNYISNLGLLPIVTLPAVIKSSKIFYWLSYFILILIFSSFYLILLSEFSPASRGRRLAGLVCIHTICAARWYSKCTAAKCCILRSSLPISYN